MKTALHGNIIEAPALGELNIIENGYILLDEEGRVEALSSEAPTGEYRIIDRSGQLVLQAFCDMHLHAPQYPMLGMGYDLELLDWLSNYTFPVELRYKDPDYARQVYSRLARELVHNGTTRVCIFSSLHTTASIVLMEELEKAGITGYVGKVQMDINESSPLLEETSLCKDETLRFLDEAKRFSELKPILTPRFTPSCSRELMAWLGELAKERGLYVQSHLSESCGEIELVLSTHPECSHYYQSYTNAGLFRDHTLMAHCVHCDDEERRAIKEAGVYVVHCADSNINIVSGFAPIRTFLNEGCHVVLGSDVAGGASLSMLRVVCDSIRASKARNYLSRNTLPFLTVAEGYYLATSAGAEYFGCKPGFAVGEKLHAVVIDDSTLFNEPRLKLKERFERCFYSCDERNITTVFANGRCVL